MVLALSRTRVLSDQRQPCAESAFDSERSRLAGSDGDGTERLADSDVVSQVIGAIVGTGPIGPNGQHVAPQLVGSVQIPARCSLAGLPRERLRSSQAEGAEKALTAEGLAAWVIDADARLKYVEAFRRPREPYVQDVSPLKKVQSPVLAIHGLKDMFLLAPALNNNWEYVEQDYTLVTVPSAGHFVQADAPELVTKTIRNWLLR